MVVSAGAHYTFQLSYAHWAGRLHFQTLAMRHGQPHCSNPPGARKNIPLIVLFLYDFFSHMLLSDSLLLSGRVLFVTSMGSLLLLVLLFLYSFFEDLFS